MEVTNGTSKAQNRPIAKHHPLNSEVAPQEKIAERVPVPNLSPPHSLDSGDGFEDWALDTYEWLSLLAMGSPRICSEDAIDPFLSRYQVPDGNEENIINMITLKWTGFITAPWIRQMFVHLSR